MFDEIVHNTVNDSLDWFFKRVLKEHYDKRRQTLTEANKNAKPAIDYVLTTCLKKNVNYPPESASSWRQHFIRLESGGNKVFKQILLIYLKLDINNHLSQKESVSKTRTKDKTELASLETALSKLLQIPKAFEFPNSVINLGTGLWAVDNEETRLIVSLLSDPNIDLSNHFNSPKELKSIIIDSLILDNQPRLALIMSKLHRCESNDENYDAIYAYLLISSGLLVEALKYERLFVDKENYTDILHRFFELCSEWNVTRSLNCLNLSIEEEEALNQYLIEESRPVTPACSQTRQVNTTTKLSTATPRPKQPSSTSKPKPAARNRSIQVVQRIPSFTDSPARNTRSARKKKHVK